jgi:hypothetical protein
LLVVLLMMLHLTQGSEPPANPVRFRAADRLMADEKSR